MKKRERTFYFLEGLGTLLWVFGDTSWLFELEYALPIIYVLAVLGNFAALVYAFLRLDRHTVPLKPVIAYNLWVIMGCLWAYAEVTESDGLLSFAKITASALVLVTILEFVVNRNNTESLIAFMRIFRKFRVREEAAGLSVADVHTLPNDLRQLFKWLMRQEEVSLAEVTSFLKQDEATCRKTLAVLVEHGYVREIEAGGKTRYRVRLASKRGREVPLNLWEALGESTEKQESGK